MSILSIGKIAADLSLPLSTVEKVARHLGQSPAMTINEVPHYSAEQVETFRRFLIEDQPRGKTLLAKPRVASA